VGVARPVGGHDLAGYRVSPAREVVISRLWRTSRGLADMTSQAGRAGHAPRAARRSIRAIMTHGLLPRTVQLCIHCHQNPAGFWVSRNNASVVRRPWCLTCCQDLDLSSCDVTPFTS
jgi:hypothetical protein